MQFEPHHDFYKDIGVDLKGRAPKDVPLEEIKQAYRKLMNQYHPDKVNQLSEAERAEALKISQAAGQAKDVLLKDPSLRERYHTYLSTGRQSGATYRPSNNQGFGRSGAFSQSFEDIWREFEAFDREVQDFLAETENFLEEQEELSRQFRAQQKHETKWALITTGALATVAVGAAIYRHFNPKKDKQDELHRDVNAQATQAMKPFKI